MNVIRYVLIYYIFILLIIYILNCLLFQSLQQLYTPFSVLFDSLLFFSHVIFLASSLIKRQSLSLGSCSFCLCSHTFLSALSVLYGSLFVSLWLFNPLNIYFFNSLKILIISFVYIYLFI